MPSVEQNRNLWNERYSWPQDGHEWSSMWGGTAPLWQYCLAPRISQYLPAKRVLEIGPGHGRWSSYLLERCAYLDLVDVSPNCIDFCRNVIADHARTRFFVNDGYHLDMLHDGSVDFAFSFDSLVHAGPDVCDSYLRALSNKLSSNGVAFIHHSNLGSIIETLPVQPTSDWECWRDRAMSGELMRQFCRDIGLTCFRQERINWAFTPNLIDCFSLICRASYSKEEVLIENHSFMNEASKVRHMVSTER